jgi:type IX secretion system PorP/SprF family membrane protein
MKAYLPTLLLLVSSIFTRLWGQDLHYSQFTAATMHLSPAAVGMMDEKARINLQYRSQWSPLLGNSNAFKTIAASYEKRKNVKSKGNNKAEDMVGYSNDFFGYGISLMSDNAASLRHEEIKGALSYARKMGGNDAKRRVHYLVGGGQLGFFRKSLNVTNGEWVNQHDGNGYHDPSRLAGTVELKQRYLFDVSMGLGWFSKLGTNTSVMGGVALHHLNRPEVAFDRKRSIYQNINMRTTYHAAGEVQVARFFTLNPSVMWMTQGAARELMAGGTIKMILREPNRASCQAGMWLRNVNRLESGSMNDAFVGFARIDWLNFGLGFSYDFSTSLLREFNASNNSIELLLSYRFGIQHELPKMITPRFL